MRTRIRVGDVIAVLIVAAIAAIVVWRPETAAPAPLASDTFSHVDVTVDAHGLQVKPATVPAGQVEIDVHADSGRTVTVALQTLPSAVELSTDHATVVALRMKRAYTITADDGATNRTAQLTVVEPSLQTPNEDAHVVSLELQRGGLAAPHRDARREEPAIDANEIDNISDSRPWTNVASGSTALTVRNRTSRDARCSVAGSDATMRVARGSSERLSILLGAGRTTTIRCTGANGAPVGEFDLRGAA